MLRHIWIRIHRKPLFFMAIALFAAIVTLTLGGLNQGNVLAREQYDEIYRSIDVRCTVTNLAGDQSRELGIGELHVALFTESGVMRDYLEDIQISSTTEITLYGEEYKLVGITSTDIAPNLWTENGCTIFWKEGFDEAVFAGETGVCIIPTALEKKLREEALPEEEIPLSLDAVSMYELDYRGTLRVIGAYEAKDSRVIYCPWDAYAAIISAARRGLRADALYGTLGDNHRLSQLREVASSYFVRPDPNYAGLSMVGEYYLGLDINDYQLAQAEINLENSMRVNRIAAGLVLVLSAAAGGFIGFLMIRSRRKEIALMRTMGTPDTRIYVQLASEQMLFVLLGAVVGGSKYLWNPGLWMALFVAVYFLGMTGALVLLIRANLLSAIRQED